MTIPIFPRWLKRKAASSHHTRRRPSQPGSGRSLALESLEARCLLSTVMNLTDHDPGSLRDAIGITLSGGTVDFQAGLTGTITLSTGELRSSSIRRIDKRLA